MFPLFSLKFIFQLDKILTILQNIGIINVCSIFSINQYNIKAVRNKNILRTFEPQNSIWIRTLSLKQGIASHPWLDRLVTRHVTAKIRLFSSCHVTGQKRKSSRHWSLRYVTLYVKLLIVRYSRVRLEFPNRGRLYKKPFFNLES